MAGGKEGVFRGFADVDHAESPDRFKAYLDTVTGYAGVQAYKRRSYESLRLGPGKRALDVGCGTGDDVGAMAKLVAPGGLVTGLDSSETMIAEARKRSAGLDLPVDFRVGDALRLDFETTPSTRPAPSERFNTFEIRSEPSAR